MPRRNRKRNQQPFSTFRVKHTNGNRSKGHHLSKARILWLERDERRLQQLFGVGPHIRRTT